MNTTTIPTCENCGFTQDEHINYMVGIRAIYLCPTQTWREKKQKKATMR